MMDAACRIGILYKLVLTAWRLETVTAGCVINLPNTYAVVCFTACVVQASEMLKYAYGMFSLFTG